MNRAFVKESDLEDSGELPERAHSDNPNYITRSGLARLEREVSRLRRDIEALKASEQLDAGSKLKTAQRDLRYFEERLRRAIPVDPPQDCDRVRFGHTVRLKDADGRVYEFTLVGEDEIDVESGRISWASPIARLLVNRQVGDELEWPRGDQRLVVEIDAIRRS